MPRRFGHPKKSAFSWIENPPSKFFHFYQLVSSCAKTMLTASKRWKSQLYRSVSRRVSSVQPATIPPEEPLRIPSPPNRNTTGKRLKLRDELLVHKETFQNAIKPKSFITKDKNNLLKESSMNPSYSNITLDRLFQLTQQSTLLQTEKDFHQYIQCIKEILQLNNISNDSIIYKSLTSRLYYLTLQRQPFHITMLRWNYLIENDLKLTLNDYEDLQKQIFSMKHYYTNQYVFKEILLTQQLHHKQQQPSSVSLTTPAAQDINKIFKNFPFQVYQQLHRLEKRLEEAESLRDEYFTRDQLLKDPIIQATFLQFHQVTDMIISQINGENSFAPPSTEQFNNLIKSLPNTPTKGSKGLEEYFSQPNRHYTQYLDILQHFFLTFSKLGYPMTFSRGFRPTGKDKRVFIDITSCFNKLYKLNQLLIDKQFISSTFMIHSRFLPSNDYTDCTYGTRNANELLCLQSFIHQIQTRTTVMPSYYDDTINQYMLNYNLEYTKKTERLLLLQQKHRNKQSLDPTIFPFNDADRDFIDLTSLDYLESTYQMLLQLKLSPTTPIRTNKLLDSIRSNNKIISNSISSNSDIRLSSTYKKLLKNQLTLCSMETIRRNFNQTFDQPSSSVYIMEKELERKLHDIIITISSEVKPNQKESTIKINHTIKSLGHHLMSHFYHSLNCASDYQKKSYFYKGLRHLTQSQYETPLQPITIATTLHNTVMRLIYPLDHPDRSYVNQLDHEELKSVLNNVNLWKIDNFHFPTIENLSNRKLMIQSLPNPMVLSNSTKVYNMNDISFLTRLEEGEKISYLEILQSRLSVNYYLHYYLRVISYFRNMANMNNHQYYVIEPRSFQRTLRSFIYLINFYDEPKKLNEYLALSSSNNNNDDDNTNNTTNNRKSNPLNLSALQTVLYDPSTIVHWIMKLYIPQQERIWSNIDKKTFQSITSEDTPCTSLVHTSMKLFNKCLYVLNYRRLRLKNRPADDENSQNPVTADSIDDVDDQNYLLSTVGITKDIRTDKKKVEALNQRILNRAEEFALICTLYRNEMNVEGKSSSLYSLPGKGLEVYNRLLKNVNSYKLKKYDIFTSKIERFDHIEVLKELIKGYCLIDSPDQALLFISQLHNTYYGTFIHDDVVKNDDSNKNISFILPRHLEKVTNNNDTGIEGTGGKNKGFFAKIESWALHGSSNDKNKVMNDQEKENDEDILRRRMNNNEVKRMWVMLLEPILIHYIKYQKFHVAQSLLQEYIINHNYPLNEDVKDLFITHYIRIHHTKQSKTVSEPDYRELIDLIDEYYQEMGISPSIHYFHKLLRISTENHDLKEFDRTLRYAKSIYPSFNEYLDQHPILVRGKTIHNDTDEDYRRNLLQEWKLKYGLKAEFIRGKAVKTGDSQVDNAVFNKKEEIEEEPVISQRKKDGIIAKLLERVLKEPLK